MSFSDFVSDYKDVSALVCEPITEGATTQDHEQLRELLADYFWQTEAAGKNKAAELIGKKIAELVEDFFRDSDAHKYYELVRD